jgi:hypothetical protein
MLGALQCVPIVLLANTRQALARLSLMSALQSALALLNFKSLEDSLAIVACQRNGMHTCKMEVFRTCKNAAVSATHQTCNMQHAWPPRVLCHPDMTN